MDPSSLEDRYLVIIVVGSAGWDSGQGQNPEPDRVQEFIKYMDKLGVIPVIYLIDPKFADPFIEDAQKFQQYPSNIIVFPGDYQDFFKLNPDLPNKPYPIAYVLPYKMVMPQQPPHQDNRNNPNRLFYTEQNRIRFDPFKIIQLGNYDPVSNRFNRELYDWRQGGIVPNLVVTDAVIPNAQINTIFNRMIEAYRKGDLTTMESLKVQLIPFIRDNFPEYLDDLTGEFNPERIQEIARTIYQWFRNKFGMRMI